MQAGSADVMAELVERDLEEPGLELQRFDPRSRVGHAGDIGANERFLHDVFGIVAAASEAVGKGIEPMLKSLDDLLEVAVRICRQQQGQGVVIIVHTQSFSPPPDLHR